MAAGCGTRLRPLTGHMPKPLVPVNGVRLIESSLKALNENGISEIYIVTGYLGEAFSYLPGKFLGVRLIRNPDYAAANNISSLYAAREYLQNAVIMDGDQLINNPAVLSRHFERSAYLAVRNEGKTHEWTLAVENGVIVGCTRGGGSGGLRLLSVSLWSKEDGARLAEDVSYEYAVMGRKGRLLG
jgi:CTP:phosphocholine cytidylyltransferase-like protein